MWTIVNTEMLVDYSNYRDALFTKEEEETEGEIERLK